MKKLYYVLACLFCVAACSKNDGDGGKGSFVPSDVCFVDTLYNELESAGNVEVKIRLAEPATGDFSVEVIASVENDLVEGEDYVFEPFMRSGAPAAEWLEGLVGSGTGSGMAVMFLCTGMLGFLASVLTGRSRWVRGLEEVKKV